LTKGVRGQESAVGDVRAAKADVDSKAVAAERTEIIGTALPI
jgi:hypothetical protein